MASGETDLLHCSLCIEPRGSVSLALKRQSYKKASIMLGRNEFRDIVLKVQADKFSAKYILKDVIVHKRFIKEGKATIEFTKQNVQLMISNCPPRNLVAFFKIMSVKLKCMSTEKTITERERLLSNKAKAFEEISPLTVKDINSIKDICPKAAKLMAGLQKTPVGTKRKEVNRMDNGHLQPQKKLAIHKNLSQFKLTDEQKQVLNAVLNGRNVFFTGSAGTGKSYLLKHIIGVLPPETTFATASTGVAACQINGTTLHAFAGIGSGKSDLQQCIQQASQKAVIQQWRKCNHLVIDEISMVDGQFFQKLEKIARILRNNDKPFGGIQLILTGDFLQLPPVSKGTENSSFCFQCDAWKKSVEISMELTQIMRQKDEKFIKILQSIRMGRCTESMADILTKTASNKLDKDGIVATRLCTHKDDVENINVSKLNELTGKMVSFDAADSDPLLSKFMDSHCPVGKYIQLKQGAQVMLTKNIDVQRGLVNGARGVVIGFDSSREGLPIVKFLCGVTQTISSERWTIKATGGTYLSRRQLPLKLGWAMSIHKSQGMTLDCVEISLARVFENGQAYVALSRACSLEGLRVMDFDRSHVRANPDVLSFYKQLSSVRSRLTASLYS